MKKIVFKVELCQFSTCFQEHKKNNFVLIGLQLPIWIEFFEEFHYWHSFVLENFKIMGDKAHNKRRKTLTPKEIEAKKWERQRKRKRRMRIKLMNNGGASNSTTIEDENIEETMVIDEANLQEVNLDLRI